MVSQQIHVCGKINRKKNWIFSQRNSDTSLVTTDYLNVCMSNFAVRPPESHPPKITVPRTPFPLPIVLQPYTHIPHDHPTMPKSKKTKSTKRLRRPSANTATYEHDDIGESEVDDDEVEDNNGSNCEGGSTSGGPTHVTKVTAASSFTVPQRCWMDATIPEYQQYLGSTNSSCAIRQSLTDKHGKWLNIQWEKFWTIFKDELLEKKDDAGAWHSVRFGLIMLATFI